MWRPQSEEVDGLGDSEEPDGVADSEDDEDDDAAVEDSADDVPVPVCPDSRAASLAAALAEARVLAPAPPRSFFAQPVPLKWIAGAANCLRMVPSAPHDGQKRGPGSWIPWRMSARWSQLEQR
jgi:hypothetical protein